MSFPFYTPVHHVLFVIHLMILIYHYKYYMWLSLYTEALFLGKMAESGNCEPCPWVRCVDLDQAGVVLGRDDKLPAPAIFMLGNMMSLMFTLHDWA